MGNAATDQHKGSQADRAHDHGALSAEGLDHKHIQQRRDRNIETNFAKQAKQELVQQFCQRTVLVHKNDQKENKQASANNRADDSGREAEGLFLLCFLFLILFGRARLRRSLLGLSRCFLLCHYVTSCQIIR